MYTANRLQRWVTTQLDYNFTIKYNRTDTIGHADALSSRLVSIQNKVSEDSVIAAVSLEPDITSVFAYTVRALPIDIWSHIFRSSASKSDAFPLYKMDKSMHRPKNSTFFSSVELHCQLMKVFFLLRAWLSHLHYRTQWSSSSNIVIKVLAIWKPLNAVVYWPNMDKQLEELARSCSNCQLAAKSLRKTTLSSRPVPESAWSRLHVDFPGPINRQCYFILVDAYSKRPEFFQMSHMTRKLK